MCLFHPYDAYVEGRVIKMPVGLRERKVKEEDPVEEFMDVDGECICFMV